MKSKNFFFSLSLAILVLTACTKKGELLNVQDNSLAVQSTSSNLKSATLSEKYIVVLKKDAGLAGLDVKMKNDRVKGKANGLLKKYEISGSIEEVYETALEGFAVKMAPGQVEKLTKDDLVSYVEADQAVTYAGRKTKPAPVPDPVIDPVPAPAPTQNTPWGVARVGGGETYAGTNVVWIIDTGIDLTHPDLNVDKTRGACFVTGNISPNDDNGHGTHVAGTIAAINNSFGVVGVAAGAKVVPVKVLDSTGYGVFSVVLAGINFVMANGKAGDVVNMSVGGGVSPTIDDAVKAASVVLKFAIAAGNETDFAYNHSPGRVNGPNVYTVTAMCIGDLWASFSNFGNTIVDYCAPGVAVYSTGKGGTYTYKSGTSMAAPHVAGLLLLGSIRTDGYVANDPDGTPDPIAHR